MHGLKRFTQLVRRPFHPRCLTWGAAHPGTGPNSKFFWMDDYRPYYRPFGWRRTNGHRDRVVPRQKCRPASLPGDVELKNHLVGGCHNRIRSVHPHRLPTLGDMVIAGNIYSI